MNSKKKTLTSQLLEICANNIPLREIKHQDEDVKVILNGLGVPEVYVNGEKKEGIVEVKTFWKTYDPLERGHKYLEVSYLEGECDGWPVTVTKRIELGGGDM